MLKETTLFYSVRGLLTRYFLPLVHVHIYRCASTCTVAGFMHLYYISQQGIKAWMDQWSKQHMRICTHIHVYVMYCHEHGLHNDTMQFSSASNNYFRVRSGK